MHRSLASEPERARPQRHLPVELGLFRPWLGQPLTLRRAHRPSASPGPRCPIACERLVDENVAERRLREPPNLVADFDQSCFLALEHHEQRPRVGFAASNPSLVVAPDVELSDRLGALVKIVADAPEHAAHWPGERTVVGKRRLDGSVHGVHINERRVKRLGLRLHCSGRGRRVGADVCHDRVDVRENGGLERAEETNVRQSGRRRLQKEQHHCASQVVKDHAVLDIVAKEHVRRVDKAVVVVNRHRPREEPVVQLGRPFAPRRSCRGRRQLWSL
eukprot:Amastigsp_a174798_42.p2 type:complete len:275 gc:universal Amastigsp_a174798_42:1594-770(-)